MAGKEKYVLSELLNPKKILDCYGLYCPEPLFQTRQQMDSLDVGEILEVLSDDPAAEEDIKRFAKRVGHEVILFENIKGKLRFLIKKGEE